MAHIEENSNLSEKEIRINELLKKGDDFYKIEIYRPALKWYKRIFEIDPQNAIAHEKVNLTEEKLRSERKVIYVVAGVAVVAVVVMLLIRML